MLGPHAKQVGFSIKREIRACPVAGVSQLHSQTHTDTHIQLYRPYVLSILSVMEMLKPTFVSRSPRNCF